jgi:hypothetical protein
MSPLAQSILDKMPWLLNDLGFRIVQDSYSPEAFGNCDVVLNGAQVRLRFVRDRGQILAYLAPLEDPDQWWNLVFLLEVIHGVMPDPEFRLEAVGRRVEENFPALVQALGPRLEETRRELGRREQLRLQALRNPVRPADESGPTWFQRISGR